MPASTTHYQVQRFKRLEWTASYRPYIPRETQKESMRSCILGLRIQGFVWRPRTNHYSLVEGGCFSCEKVICPRASEQAGQSDRTHQQHPLQITAQEKTFPTVKSEGKAQSILQTLSYNLLYWLYFQSTLCDGHLFVLSFLTRPLCKEMA